MRIYIEKACIERYAEVNCNAVQKIRLALDNLKKAATLKEYKIKHIPRNDSNSIAVNIPDIRFDFERFLNDKIDVSDVINFALKLYLPIFLRERKKERIKEAFDETYIAKLFENLNIEIEGNEVDEERNRIYYYTKCPACGTERFYFSLDLFSQNIFVGCLNVRCNFYNRNRVDIVGFLIKQYNKTFAETIDFLYEICEQKTEEENDKFANTPFYTNMTISDFQYFGFNEEVVSKCFIITEVEGENPIVYKNKGEESNVYVIVYDILDAIRIRKNNSKVNIMAIYSNTISEDQLKIICDCVPKQSKIIIAFSNNVPSFIVEEEIEKLKQSGYQQIEIADIPPQYTSFADMMFDDPAIEREEVNRSLRIC